MRRTSWAARCRRSAVGWPGRSEPDYFTRCAVERQMREGHDPFMRYVQRISARWHARFAAEIECDGPIVYCSHS